MYKFLIIDNLEKTYDKIFKVIDKHSTFSRVNTENEYQTEEGYVLEFSDIPPDAREAIGNMKNVIEL